MNCPIIISEQAKIETKCTCHNNNTVRKVTFTWQIDSSAAAGIPSFKTCVSIHDGITLQWLNVEPIEGSPDQDEYTQELFLSPGSYQWQARILDPIECRTPLPTDLVFGLPLYIDNCCNQTEDLLGDIHIFSVKKDYSVEDIDLTDDLKNNGCVNTSEVIAVLPETECPALYEWISPSFVLNSPERRSYPIQLPSDGSPIKITAQVTLAGCYPKQMSIEVRKCVNSKPPKRKWWCLGKESCSFYEAMAIYPIISLIFFSGVETVVLSIVIALVATFKVIWPYVVAVGCMVGFFFLGIILLHILCISVFFFFWLSCCKVDQCRLYADLDWAIGWGILVTSILGPAGWFFFPLQFIVMFVIRHQMLQLNCTNLDYFSLPHTRP